MQMERPKHARRRAGIAAGALAAMLAIGGTVAYLTAHDSVVNRFELDTNMQTMIVEPSWDPENGKGIVPTQTVAKDPAVQNTGTVSQYVSVKVKAPVYSGKVFDPATNTVSDVTDADLFSWEANEGWTLIQTEGPEEGFRTYTYVYESVLAAGETTPAVFDTVTEANLLEDVGIDATSITVNADAIQSVGFSNAKEAFDAMNGQGGGSTGDVTPAEVTIVVDPQDGTDPLVIKGAAGSQVDAELPAPSRTGYTFAGWFDAPEGGEAVAGLPERFPEGGASYYAQWTANPQAIILHANDRDVSDERVKGVTDEALPEAVAGQPLPTPVSSTGLVFAGWHTLDGTDTGEWGDEVATWPSTFPATDAGVTDYWAKWQAAPVTVSFDMGDSGLAQIEDVQVPGGSFAEKPSGIAVENGYEVKFYTDAECTSEFDFEATPITSDTTVYVGVAPLPARIVFNSNCASEVEAIEGYTGMVLDIDAELPTTTYTAMSRASEPSYEFDAWYTENGAQEGDLVGNDEDWGHPVTSLAYFKYEMPPGETVLNARFSDANDTSVVPFAVLTTDGDLVFYKRAASEIPAEGSVYDGNTVDVVYDGIGVESAVTEKLANGSTKLHTVIPYSTDKQYVKTVSYRDQYRPKSLQSMFADLPNLVSADLSNVDTSMLSTTSMAFSNCPKLEAVTGLDGWNVSNMSSMNGMFLMDASLASVGDLSGWSFQGCRLESMFAGCSSLSGLGSVAGWDVSKVRSANQLFHSCSSLESLGDLSGWDTSNMTDMSEMFYNCTSLADASGIESWNTSKVMDMGSMFYNDGMLADCDLSGWDVSSVTDMSYMFFGAPVAGALDLSGWDVSGVADMSYMFSSFGTSTTFLNLSGWDVSGVSQSTKMLQVSTKLNSLDLSGWKTADAAAAIAMAGSVTSLERLDLSDWDVSGVTDMSGMFKNKATLVILDLTNWDVSNVTTMANMFNGCKNIEEIVGANAWNTSRVASLDSCFTNCTSLSDIGFLSGWNTSTATSMAGTFLGCISLADCNALADWSTAKVQSLSGLFQGCTSLVAIDGLVGWNTGAVKNMDYMFNGCNKVESLRALEGWNTGHVESMKWLAVGCNALEEIDFSQWDTSSLTSIKDIIYSCTNVVVANLSNWNLSSVSDYSNTGFVVSGSPKLDTVYMRNWNVAGRAFEDGPDAFIPMVRVLDISGWTCPAGVLNDVAYWLDGGSNTEELDMSNWDTSSLTDCSLLQEVIGSCSNILKASFAGWDVSGITNLNEMLGDSRNVLGGKLETLDLSGWNTSGIKDMSNMFDYHANLTTINLSGWDTSSVTSMRYMFYDSYRLTSIIGVEDFDTRNVTDMTGTFARAARMSGGQYLNPYQFDLDVSSWNVAKVTSHADFAKNVNGIIEPSWVS